MWNKCEVTFTCYRRGDHVTMQLDEPGALPDGWVLHRVEPTARSYDLVFRVEGLNLTYEAGRHVQRSLERLGLR